MRGLVALAIVFLLAACGSAQQRTSAPEQIEPTASGSRKGAYYKDDGPGANAPPNLEQTPDAVPRAEPLHRFANRPYEVFGKQYVPMTQSAGFRERGRGSWYGRRYHGKQTSSGEIYDMYAMTAAHTILPIPSYARVTNPANGRSVVVRINDRGPFLAGRVIDLSYTAALKLGYIDAGSALDDVPGLGPSRRQALMAAFGSVRKIRAASVEEVAAVPGFGRATAESVVAALAADTPGPTVDTATGEIVEDR